MNKLFNTFSKRLLMNILKEPGGYSFFPSPIFWKDLSGGRSKEYVSFRHKKKNFLYIHIPFCGKICSYCNCFKKKLSLKTEIDTYLLYLDKEAKLLYELHGKKAVLIEGIFVGGGTPNILSIEQLHTLNIIINKYFLKDNFVGFAIDGHPNLYSTKKLLALKDIGVDRVTFAIQTFNDSLLREHNRDIYDRDVLSKNIHYAQSIGLKINIDLMVGLKGQKFIDFIEDIKYLEGMPIDNVSLHYMMPSSNIDYSLDSNYKTLIQEVKDYVGNHPVLSNSQNLLESYYVSETCNMISLGASGVSSFYGYSILQKPSIDIYYEQLNDGIYPIERGLLLELKDEMHKYIFLYIVGEGVDIDKFFMRFGVSIWEAFTEEWRYLKLHKAIEIRDGRICSLLTDRELLIHMNIFFLKKVRNLQLHNYTLSELDTFFLKDGDLIDK